LESCFREILGRDLCVRSMGSPRFSFISFETPDSSQSFSGKRWQLLKS